MNSVIPRRATQAGVAVFTAVLLVGAAGFGGHRMLEDVSPDELLAKMDRGMHWALWKVEATPEQRAQA